MRQREEVQEVLWSRRGFLKLGTLGLHLAGFSLFLWGCASDVRPVFREILVAGRVQDVEGEPVPGLPVKVLAAEMHLDAASLAPGSRFPVLAQNFTDVDGSFRLTFRPRPEPAFYYLSLYAPGDFDDVKYKVPPLIELPLPEAPTLTRDITLEFHPRWPETLERIKALGVESQQARVLRRWGLPDREDVREEGEGVKTEVWWYYGKGKSFKFREGILLREYAFPPIGKKEP